MLLAMPFASPHHPNIGLSLIQAGLRRHEIVCDLRYFFLEYAERCGVEAYKILTDDRYFTALLGEWVFGSLVHERSPGSEMKYISEVLQSQCKDFFNVQWLLQILACKESASGFIDSCLASVDWQTYSIVGLTTSFQQTMASLALAQRLKRRHAHLVIALGGANCEGEMGIELHRQYPFIDIVCSGEGDIAFVEAVRRLREGKTLAGIPGIIFRAGNETVVPMEHTNPVARLDDLPIPDYSDFYQQRSRCPEVSAHYSPVALFETSRGCWWGAKKHCTFCGLNGGTMTYRSKSQNRALDELSELTALYGHDVLVVDNILDLNYFKEFFPALASSASPLLMHYETKVNLTPDQIALLAAAGVRKIQPGVESLDSAILKLMRKGCTLMQNVQTLKIAAEAGVYVEWNFLYGFPQETDAHYERQAAIIPLLRHLNAPSALTRVRADRFSPYFATPQQFGLRLTPLSAYEQIYPFDVSVIRRLAYHFTMHSDELLAAEQYTQVARRRIEEWHSEQKDAFLFLTDYNSRIEVQDGRSIGAPKPHTVTGAAAEVLRACWKIRSRQEISRLVAHRGEAEIDSALVELRERGLTLQEGGQIISLPLRQPGWKRAPRPDEIRDSLGKAFFRWRGKPVARTRPLTPVDVLTAINL